MDADSSMVDNREGNTFGMNLLVLWDAPESVVDVSSAGVVPLRDLPDGMYGTGGPSKRCDRESYPTR